MQLYKFMEVGGRRVALTADSSGGKLPKVGNGWKAAGEMNIDAADGPRIGAGSAEIIAGVEKDGYFVWPVTDA